MMMGAQPLHTATVICHAAAAAALSAFATGVAAADNTEDADVGAATAGEDSLIRTLLPLVVGVVCSAAALSACLFGSKPKNAATDKAYMPDQGRPVVGVGRMNLAGSSAPPTGVPLSVVRTAPVQTRGEAARSPPGPVAGASPPPNLQELYSKPQKRGTVGGRPVSAVGAPQSGQPSPPAPAELLYEDLDVAAPPVFQLRAGGEGAGGKGQFARITLQEAERSLKRGEKVFTPSRNAPAAQQATGGTGGADEETLYEAVADLQALYARPVKKRPVSGFGGTGVSGPPPATPAPDPTADHIGDLYTAVVKPRRGTAGGGGAYPSPDVVADSNYENIDTVVSRMASSQVADGGFPNSTQPGASGDLYQSIDEFISAPTLAPVPDARRAEKAANESNYVPLETLVKEHAAALLYQPIDEIIPQDVRAPTFVMHCAGDRLKENGTPAADPGLSQNDRYIAAWRKIDMSRDEAERYLYASK